MVTVTFRRDSHNRLSSVFADGHADWAEDGRDLACAAVSAILQAAWVGLTDHLHVEIEGDRTKARLSMRWPEAERGREGVEAIIATAELGVREIARQYPKNVSAKQAKEP